MDQTKDPPSESKMFTLGLSADMTRSKNQVPSLMCSFAKKDDFLVLLIKYFFLAAHPLNNNSFEARGEWFLYYKIRPANP